MKQSLSRIAVAVLLLTNLLRADVGTITASPSPVTFTSTNPDLSPVSAPVTLTFQISGGATAKTWYMNVQASQDPLANCSTVPDSAITVQCTSASVTNSGTGTCSGSFPLSASPATQFVGGTQGAGSSNYTVHVTYLLADKWKYKVGACSLTLTYVVWQQN